MFILVIKLLEDFSDRVGGQVWVFDSSIDDIHDRFGIRALVADAVLEVLVSILIEFDLLVVKELFPVIGPALTELIPSSWARFTIAVLVACEIILAESRHVNLHLSKDLFV